MGQIKRGQLGNKIDSAVVRFHDTGEQQTLAIRGLSANHFFPRFMVGTDEIQLRLDWTDLDSNGQPTLDADFINPKTGKHRSLSGERLAAHHTASVNGESRSYEWAFLDFCRKFSVLIAWRVSIEESCTASDSCSVELFRGSDSQMKGG